MDIMFLMTFNLLKMPWKSAKGMSGLYKHGDETITPKIYMCNGKRTVGWKTHRSKIWELPYQF